MRIPSTAISPVGHNGAVRKLIITLASLVALVLVVDFAAATFTEYRVSRAIRHGANLGDDPAVTVSGFPFLTQVSDGTLDALTVRARNVPSDLVGQLLVEARFEGVHLPSSSWVIDTDAPMRVDRAEGRLIIGQTSLGQLLGVPDLELSAPPSDKSDGTGGSGGVGLVNLGPAISANAVLLTGTVQVGEDEKGPVRKQVSVLARLLLVDEKVHIIPSAVYQPHALDSASDDDEPLSLDVAGPQFAATINANDLPFGITPTSVRARGSELIIEGSDKDVTLRVADLLKTTTTPTVE